MCSFGQSRKHTYIVLELPLPLSLPLPLPVPGGGDWARSGSKTSLAASLSSYSWYSCSSENCTVSLGVANESTYPLEQLRVQPLTADRPGGVVHQQVVKV